MAILPFVSIIIPCCNEEEFIDKCLNSIIDNDYPKERLEILVVDGMSDDGTRKIIKDYTQKYPYINFLNNPKRDTPIAFNIGIEHAKGEFIAILSAHATYEKDYISKCVNYLEEHEVDSVGGKMITVSLDNTLIAKSIIMVLSHRFGVGNSYFRTGSTKPRLVDTVPFCCYRKEIFEKIGLFNEHLIRNQDIEFNLRLKRSGGKILLSPDILSYYYARSSLRSLFKQNFQNGFWVIYSNKFAKIPFSLRHLIPFVFVLSLCGSLFLSFFWTPFIYLFLAIFGAYFIANMSFSLKLSFKNRLSLLPVVMISFFILHFSYGIGSLWGTIKLVIPDEVKTGYK